MPTGSPAPVAPDTAPPGPDLSYIPADFHVDGKPDPTKFAAHYQELVAERTARTAQLPEGDYDFALTPDLKFDGIDVPADFTAQLRLDDPSMQPLFSELSGVLKEIGAPGTAGQKLMGVLAKYEAVKWAEQAKADKEFRAEREKDMAALGTPAQQQVRMATVERALQTRLPADQVEALKATMTSAKALQAVEKLLGPAGLTAPVTAPPGVSSEGLSAYDRLKLANSTGR